MECLNPGLRKTSLLLVSVVIRIASSPLTSTDVLMVWHSYLLNPRCFFEDCLRWGKLDWYATGLPWSQIDACIDNMTFEYLARDEARKTFVERTGHPWDNLEEPSEHTLQCPGCKAHRRSPWTHESGYFPDRTDFC